MKMVTQQKIIGRFKDGSVKKGTVQNFSPNNVSFYLLTSDGQTLVVKMEELKAVFFVKDYLGNKLRKDINKISRSNIQAGAGRMIKVTFSDDEMIVGYSTGYSSNRQGFFMIPADKGGNNERIYVITSATKKIELI